LTLLKRAKEVLHTLTATPVGVVLNRVSSQRKNRYFATAVPTRAEAKKWAPATAYEVKANGNGHSHDPGNGQRAEAMPAPALMTPPVVAPAPVKSSALPPSMPPSPAPNRWPYQ